MLWMVRLTSVSSVDIYLWLEKSWSEWYVSLIKEYKVLSGSRRLLILQTVPRNKITSLIFVGLFGATVNRNLEPPICPDLHWSLELGYSYHHYHYFHSRSMFSDRFSDLGFKILPCCCKHENRKNRYLNLRCPQVEGLQTLICFALPYADDWKKKVAN